MRRAPAVVAVLALALSASTVAAGGSKGRPKPPAKRKSLFGWLLGEPGAHVEVEPSQPAHGHLPREAGHTSPKPTVKESAGDGGGTGGDHHRSLILGPNGKPIGGEDVGEHAGEHHAIIVEPARLLPRTASGATTPVHTTRTDPTPARKPSEEPASSSGGGGGSTSSSSSSSSSSSKGPSSGRSFDWERPSEPIKPIKPPKPRAERLPGRVVTSAGSFPLSRHKVRVAVLGRGDSSSFSVPYSLPGRTKSFGRLVAGKRYPLLTGGGKGLPREAEQAAHDEGGETWAISAAKDADEQLEGLFDASWTSILYATGTGGGGGTIEREAPLVQLANVRTYWNGGPGTFGELVAGLYEPGVIALLAESGGVAGDAAEKILPYVGVPDHIRVVTSRDEGRLLAKAEDALAELERAGVKTTPSREALYSPRPHRSAVPEAVRDDHTVMSFLLDDGGRATARDQSRTVKLVDAALGTRMKGKKPFSIAYDNPTSRAALMRGALEQDVDGVLVTADEGPDVNVRPKDRSAGKTANASIKVRRSGKGHGVGEFAAHREVVEHADVIFVTSAYFKNLSGLAFALRQSKKSIIAVLELDSTGSRHLERILRTAAGKSLGSRFIFDTDPNRLVARAQDKLEEPPRPKWSSDYGSLGSDDGWRGSGGSTKSKEKDRDKKDGDKKDKDKDKDKKDERDRTKDAPSPRVELD